MNLFDYFEQLRKKRGDDVRAGIEEYSRDLFSRQRERNAEFLRVPTTKEEKTAVVDRLIGSTDIAKNVLKEIPRSTARNFVRVVSLPMETRTIDPSGSRLGRFVFGEKPFKTGIEGLKEEGESFGLAGSAATIVGSISAGADVVSPNPLSIFAKSNRNALKKSAKTISKMDDVTAVKSELDYRAPWLPEETKIRLADEFARTSDAFEIEARLTKETADFIGVTQDALKVTEGVDADEIMAKRIADQKKALAQAKSSIPERIAKGLEKGYAEIVDKTYPILKGLKGDDLLAMETALARIARSGEVARQTVKDLGLEKVIQSIPAESREAFDQYLIARHNMYLNAAGFEKGLDAAEDAAIVARYGEQFEPLAKEVTAVTERMLDMMVNRFKTLSPELAARLKEIYPKYVPLNVVMEPIESAKKFKVQKGLATLSQQTTVQKLTGSKRAIYSPIESIVLKLERMVDEGLRNEAALIIADIARRDPGNALGVQKVLDATDIEQRMSAIKEMAEMKGVREMARGLRNKYGTLIKDLRDSLRDFLRNGDIQYRKTQAKGTRETAQYSKELAMRAKKNLPKSWEDLRNVLIVKDGRVDANLLERIKADFEGEGVASFVDFLHRAGIKNFAEMYEIPETAARTIVGRMFDNPIFMHPMEFPADMQKFMNAESLEEMSELLVAANSPEGKALLDLLAGKKARLNDGLDLIRQRMAMRLDVDKEKMRGLVDGLTKAKNAFDEAVARGQDAYARLRAVKTPDVPKGYDTFHAIRGGVQETYMAPQEVVDAIKNLGRETMDMATGWMSAIQKIRKLGITGLSAVFAARNLFRDMRASFVLTNAKFPWRSAANPYYAVKGLFEVLGKGESFEDMVRYGGAGNFLQTSRETAPMTVSKIASQRSKMERFKHIVKTPSEWLDTIQDVISIPENSIRQANFIAKRDEMLKAGASLDEANRLAAKNAREATIDFFRSGRSSPVLNVWLLYFNANIQGTRMWADAFRREPRVTATRMFFSHVMPTALTTMHNIVNHEDIYRDISPYVKENFNVIITDDAKWNEDERKWEGVILVPINPGIEAAVMGYTRRFLEAAYEVDPLNTKEMFGMAIESVVPYTNNMLTRDGLKLQRPVQNLLAGTPVGPTAEAAMNYSAFRERSILSERDMEVLPGERASENTDYVYKWLGQKFPELISPKSIEYAVEGQFGIPAKTLTNMVANVLSLFGAIEKEEKGGQTLIKQLSSAFADAPGGQIEREATDEASQFKLKSQTEARKLKEKRRKVIEKIIAAPKEERGNLLREEAKKDVGIVDEMEKYFDEKKFDYSYEEKQIRDMNVKDGTRARYIAMKMARLKTKEEKANYLMTMASKKLVSEEVLGQLVEILQEQANKKSDE